MREFAEIGKQGKNAQGKNTRAKKMTSYRGNLARCFFVSLFSSLLLALAVTGSGFSKTAQAQVQAQLVDYPFHNAIRLQDFAEARRLLDKGGRKLLTETDSFGMLPLHSAASIGSMEAIEFLIDEGVDVRYIPQGGYSPLVRGRSPLHLAVATGNTQIIDLLVKSGIDVFAQDSGGVTPLHLAVQYGRLSATTRLIELGGQGEQAHIRDKNGTTPLHLAARHGRGIIITRLLFLGDKEKSTLGERLQKLLEGKTEPQRDSARQWRVGLVNTQNNFGLSPLHYAAAGGHEEAIQLLLEQGARINITNNQGLTPLFLAARDGRENVVEILASRNGIDLEGGDPQSHSPLCIAVMNGHLKVFTRLFDRGADPYAKNITGMTPLHMASRGGNLQGVAALLKIYRGDKSNINETDKAGNTPLHYATQTGKKELVERLLQAGADSRLRNGKDETAQDIARELGHDEVLAVLR